jgi:hypothetical protein
VLRIAKRHHTRNRYQQAKERNDSDNFAVRKIEI